MVNTEKMANKEKKANTAKTATWRSKTLSIIIHHCLFVLWTQNSATATEIAESSL